MGNEQSTTTGLTQEELDHHRRLGAQKGVILLDEAKRNAAEQTRLKEKQAREEAEEELRRCKDDKLLQLQQREWEIQQQKRREEEAELEATKNADAEAKKKADDEEARKPKLALKQSKQDQGRGQAEQATAGAKAQRSAARDAERQALAERAKAAEEQIAKAKKRTEFQKKFPTRPKDGQQTVTFPVEPQSAGSSKSASRKSSNASDSGGDPLASWNPRKEPTSAATSAGIKRPASGPSGFEDERRSSVQRVPKKPKTSAVTSPQSPLSPTDGSGRKPPQWYLDTKPDTGRTNNEADGILDSLKSSIVRAKNAQLKNFSHEVRRIEPEIRRKLHTLAFIPVNEKVLRTKRVLHSADGLPQLFDGAFAGGIDWPFDIKADAEELYTKWYEEDFSTDMLRGIDTKPDNKGKGAKIKSGKQDFHEYGHGNLVNGQWWPLQICALRDGAHGSIQGGISGKKGEGVYSVVLSGGGAANYPDQDDGDVVQYCGVDDPHETGAVQLQTQMLLDAEANGFPIRFIRSSEARYKSEHASKYAPEKGFRYDGLYKAVKHEVLAPSKLARYRFRLERLPGQPPIRWDGPGQRPTKEELEEYAKHKRLQGGK